MSNFLYFIVNIIKIIVITMITSLGMINPASAMTQDLLFTTNTGYSINITFTYDETKNPQVIMERGVGKTNILDSLQVKFYKPSGDLIANYNNIVNGIVKGTYFEFNFDPATKQIFGNLDLGGEMVGDIYLKGELAQRLSLIEVKATGKEKIIDLVNNS